MRRTMKAKILVYVLAALFLAAIHLAEAQQPKKVYRIGFLEGASIAESQGIEPFRQGLRSLGYVDGQNVIIEVRAMEGKPDRLSGMVAEFVESKVDVIFSAFTSGAQAAKKATPTIPIVFVSPDPVGMGLVASLAKPGGNTTGLSSFAELAGKRLEILKDAIPNLSRVAVFGNVSAPASAHYLQLKETEVAASVLGITLRAFEVRDPEDFERAFKGALSGRARALIPLRSPMLVNHRKQFLKLAGEHRLPAMYDDKNFVEPGGLMSYGTDRADLFRRAAVYVDKILKGAKPADLPVEQPMKFEFVINLKTAKQIGLVIPPNVLARADRIIR
jgi:putative tryptophan/tyrosine transport system substrate-binding protein